MNTTIINEAIADAIIRSISDYEGNFSLDVDIDANTFAQVSGHYEIQARLLADNSRHILHTPVQITIHDKAARRRRGIYPIVR